MTHISQLIIAFEVVFTASSDIIEDSSVRRENDVIDGIPYDHI